MSLDDFINAENRSAIDALESSVEMVRDTRSPRDKQEEENERARLRQQEKRLKRKQKRSPGSTGNRPLQDDAIDFAPRPVQDETFPGGGGDPSTLEFNVSLAVCNSGTPGYINTIFDADRGFYTSAPDFPIPAP